MRSYDPNCEYEVKDLNRLNPEPWQVKMLELNPSYVHWGPGEDYMPSAEKSGGWGSSLAYDSWKVFEPQFGLDELNECVNFYFSIERESVNCSVCGGDGYHPDAHWVTESFYKHSSPFADMGYRNNANSLARSFGLEVNNNKPFPKMPVDKYGPEFRQFCKEMQTHIQWSDRITQDELDVLWEEHRLGNYGKNPVKPTLEFINANQWKRGMGNYSHDGINRGILIKQRLKRFGMPDTCEKCGGYGYCYTADHCDLSLTLWILHPRKGAARGVLIKSIEQDDLPNVGKWLAEADDRNRDRFNKARTALCQTV